MNNALARSSGYYPRPNFVAFEDPSLPVISDEELPSHSTSSSSYSAPVPTSSPSKINYPDSYFPDSNFVAYPPTDTIPSYPVWPHTNFPPSDNYFSQFSHTKINPWHHNDTHSTGLTDSPKINKKMTAAEKK
ncbi:hypothetical protein Ciccas_014164, partial [Cichlidogyrus casuarinus]